MLGISLLTLLIQLLFLTIKPDFLNLGSNHLLYLPVVLTSPIKLYVALPTRSQRNLIYNCYLREQLTRTSKS